MSARRRHEGTKLPGTPNPMHMWPGARGINIAADSWGDPQGPLVLLQHGGGQTRHAWKRTGEFLGDVGYLATAFDARGHGDSDWAPDGVFGPDVMVEDLLGVIAHLGRRSAVLVGASPHRPSTSCSGSCLRRREQDEQGTVDAARKPLLGTRAWVFSGSAKPPTRGRSACPANPNHCSDRLDLLRSHHAKPWRGGRVVECAGLEIRCTVMPYRRFESDPLRQGCRLPLKTCSPSNSHVMRGFCAWLSAAVF